MVLNEYVTRLPLFSNEKIRDTLYNIDQFKFDALLQPEIKMRGPPSSHSNTSNSSTNSSTKSGGSLGAGVAGGRGTGMPGATGGPGGAQNNAMSKRMIKDSDKSSGTNNLVGTGGGSSTLTGKNPFAILKASSIAASQSAVFPNNFQNLPKVSPPFLPPL